MTLVFFLSWLMQLEGCEIEEGHTHPLRRKWKFSEIFLKCAVSRQPKVLIWNAFAWPLVFYLPGLRGSEV